MARKTRMVLNREALHQVDLGMAAGLERLAMKVLTEADKDVPDQPVYGEGLIDNGIWISYVDGKKVGQDQPGIKKPRDFKVRGRGVAVAGGYPFPARFNEMGTVHQPPRPFLSPALIAVVGDRRAVEEAMYTAFRSYLTRKALRLQRQHNTSPSALIGRFR